MYNVFFFSFIIKYWLTHVKFADYLHCEIVRTSVTLNGLFHHFHDLQVCVMLVLTGGGAADQFSSSRSVSGFAITITARLKSACLRLHSSSVLLHFTLIPLSPIGYSDCDRVVLYCLESLMTRQISSREIRRFAPLPPIILIVFLSVFPNLRENPWNVETICPNTRTCVKILKHTVGGADTIMQPHPWHLARVTETNALEENIFLNCAALQQLVP